MNGAQRRDASPQRRTLALRALAAWVLWVVVCLPATAGDAAGLVQLDHATFQREGDAPRVVTLPHTWALDGLPASGAGRYRLEFQLAAVPTRPWALGAQRLGSRHAVWLNGALVQGDGAAAADHRGVPVAALVDLPPTLLRAGANLVEIHVDFDIRAGMSPLVVGPTEWVQPAFVRAYTWSVTVPQAMNVAATGLALFMLTIWLRRPSERELGAFCGFMVATSLRNVISTGAGNQWHNAATDFVLYTLQVLSVVLLTRFGLAFAQREWPLLRRVVDGVGAVLIAAGAAAAWFDALTALRVIAYPVLLTLVLPSLWFLGVGARRTGGVRQAALTLAIVLLAGAAVHDYFFLRGLISVMDRYWMPFTSPLALAIFAWSLLDRFAGALASVETHATDLERKVAERTRELELANAAKTRFLAAASHDLRQPVVSISLLSELLREQPAPAAMNMVLDRIGDSAHALNTLLKGLLDLSRFDAGAVQARHARVALLPLLQTVVGDEREAAQRKGIGLRLRAPPLEVRSDPLLLEQILRNLVGNAVRYTTRGGVLVSVRRRGQERVLVQVWDTGPGIPPESQTLVFEEFVQLDNEARERSRGLGLGLSLVKRAAQVLHVPLALRSRSGRGSCFSVELPFAGVASAPLHGASPAVADLHGKRVWVVEDDPDVRDAMRLRFAAWGANVCTFDGARAVCDAIAADDTVPDLLVTDQRLPDGSGLEVAQRLRTRCAGVPALVVTGDTAPSDVVRLRDSGLPVLHKPFTSEELLAASAGLVADGALRGATRVAPPRPPPGSAI